MSPQLLRRLRSFVNGQAVYSSLDTASATLVYGINPLQRGNIIGHYRMLCAWERGH